MILLRSRVTTALVLVMLALPGSAVAQTPGDDTYSDSLEQVQAHDPGTTVSRGGIPFTGLEVGLMLLVASGLVGTGIVLRRASRQHEDS